MYPQSTLDDIRERLSIAALIGERVPLKKAGRNFKGCCPFHNEKTPSFMVSDEKQIYHCFGCGEGGDIFKFYMKFNGMSFREAVEALAERAGVRLPTLAKADKEKEDAVSVKKKWAFRLNEIVAEYFVNNLRDPKKGEQARNYLKSRNIFFEKSTQHFLGYADDTWDGLVRYLTSKKAPLDLAVELGLLKRRDDGGYYDFFRHRIMFPVITPDLGKSESVFKGKVVAFSGRTFGAPVTSEGREAPAKYLNSPDSVIYHKSHTLFGFDVAREEIRKKDFVVIVEGNLDTVRLQMEGIANTVAPLGTALTAGHIKFLQRYTKNFVLIFDGDEAGQKASIRSMPLFLEEGLLPKVVTLEAGEDPDSFVARNGAEALLKKIGDALLLFEWIIDATAERFGSGTDGKVKAVEFLKPLLGQVRNPVELSQYKRRIAGKLSLDESVISVGAPSKKGAWNTQAIAVKDEGSSSVEKMVIELLLCAPERGKDIFERISPDTFGDESIRTIFLMALEHFKANGVLNVAKFVEGIGDEELKKEVLGFAISEGKYEDVDAAVKGCMDSIEKASKKRTIKELTESIRTIKDEKSVLKTMQEIQRITKELHGI